MVGLYHSLSTGSHAQMYVYAMHGDMTHMQCMETKVHCILPVNSYDLQVQNCSVTVLFPIFFRYPKPTRYSMHAPEPDRT